MTDAAVTISQLWTVGVAFAALLGGFFLWTWNNLRGKANGPAVDRAWTELRQTQKDLTDHKIEVAQRYVTGEQLREMEGRMMRHFDAKADDLKDAISELKASR